jgi:hypothetical protein
MMSATTRASVDVRRITGRQYQPICRISGFKEARRAVAPRSNKWRGEERKSNIIGN